jgi:glucuronate isomerase
MSVGLGTRARTPAVVAKRKPRAARVKTFLGDDFLLDTRIAVDLYERWARRQPIIDYHNHLSPAQIAGNHQFRSMTELWLEGDHYKWRAMRASGIAERNITGDASDWEKFAAWARTVPGTIRNPLYHWTHLELAFPFGVTGARLGPHTARQIFEHCNDRLSEPGFTAQGLLAQYDVRIVCSTDDPTDDLAPHARHAENPAAFTKLYPTFRPDRVLGLHDIPAWNAWVDRLGAAAGLTIATLDELRDALARRHDLFHARGCRASDHGLERVYAAPYTEREAAAIFAKGRSGAELAPDEIEKLRSAFSYDLAVMDHGKGWVQQLHLGAMRNLSTRAFRRLGPDTGYDAIGDFAQAEPLARFLDRLDREGRLAKTIIYNLNPADNEVLTTIAGCFQEGAGAGAGSAGGKMQIGSAWWFMDHLEGMERQLSALSNLGLLSRFVGMLTDSRSFLSFSRHDYFRRLLCNLLGNDVARGHLPNDGALLGQLVEDVCFRNVRDYFGFVLS